MPCCITARRDGGLLKCKKCEKGYKLSSSKMQCVPDHGCPDGQGPGHNGIDKAGSCFDCADDNCAVCTFDETPMIDKPCSMTLQPCPLPTHIGRLDITTTGSIVYTSCVRCKDGYLKDQWNQCYNLLLGGSGN